jgi:hypothetical protein
VRSTALAFDDLRLELRRREVELEAHEALARARLQILQKALVARVIRDHEHEARRRAQELAGLVYWQQAAVIGERMQHDHRVCARLDHLVEVTDGAGARGAREWPVVPRRAVVVNQVAADQIARGEIVVAGDADERTLQTPRHVLDEARFSAPGRPLEHHGELARVTLLEHRHLVADRQVEGLLDRREQPV